MQVFIIGPDKRLKLSLLYPATTGRNFDEILRVVDSLQITAGKRVATPADWMVCHLSYLSVIIQQLTVETCIDLLQYRITLFLSCVCPPPARRLRDGPSQHVRGGGGSFVPRWRLHQRAALWQEVPALHAAAVNTGRDGTH